MIRRCWNAQFWLALLFGATAAMAADTEFVTTAKKLIGYINADDQIKIHEMLGPALRGTFTEAKARVYFRSILAARGNLLDVKESVASGGGASLLLGAERGEWRMALTLDRKGQITGLNLTPAGAIIALPERNKTPMRLPFNGEWYVRWGGATAELNRNANIRSQRRALDMLIRDSLHKSHQDEGKANEDYYVYGTDILAPADGTVVMVIDGVPDSKPGTPNGFCAIGNSIMIKHSDSEFSVLEHLMFGSICVRVGDTVKAGQLIGRCGNSGQSNEPHLHFHLQNLPDMEEASGFEPYFQNIRVTRDLRARVERDYSPIRGDSVAQLAVETPTKAAK